MCFGTEFFGDVELLSISVIIIEIREIDMDCYVIIRMNCYITENDSTKNR